MSRRQLFKCPECPQEPFGSYFACTAAHFAGLRCLGSKESQCRRTLDDGLAGPTTDGDDSLSSLLTSYACPDRRLHLHLWNMGRMIF